MFTHTATSFAHSVGEFKNTINTSANLQTDKACLSILTTTDDSFTLSSDWKLKKQVIFEDTENPLNPKALTSEQAKDIVMYLMQVHEKGLPLHVHCHMGISRSKAVSLFYEEILCNNPVQDLSRSSYHLHNRYVYILLLNAYMNIVDEGF